MAWSLLENIEQHEGLIPVSTIAKWLGVHRTTVYDMLDSGEIPEAELGAEQDKKHRRVDPRTWKYVLQRRDSLMREARRRCV